MYSCHSIPECCVMFSGVKLSIRSFVLFIKVIHFTCLIFVSNNCFQDHRIIKSVMDRLIGILCILARSCITYLVSIASQIKDIVLFNILKTKRKCWKGFSTKFYQQ